MRHIPLTDRLDRAAEYLKDAVRIEDGDAPVPAPDGPDGPRSGEQTVIRRAKPTCDADGNWTTIETVRAPQAAGELEQLPDGTVIGEAAFRARLRRRAGITCSPEEQVPEVA